MRLIFLFMSRNARRWLCAAAIALSWLAVCQPATAAVSCSASTQNTVIYYSNSILVYGGNLLTTVNCTGFTGASTNQFVMCTTSDATAGLNGAGRRNAFNSSGKSIEFNLYSDDQSDLLNSGGLVIANGNFGTSSSGGVLSQSTFVRAPYMTFFNVGAIPAGDYVSTVSMTVDIRTKNQASALNCSGGTSAGLMMLTIPITIRVAGAACSINSVENVNFGDITVNSATGRVTAMTTLAVIELSCVQGTSWTMTISDGNNPFGTGPYRRRMVNGSSYLAYGFGTSSSSPTTNMTLSGSVGTYDSANERVVFYGFLQSQIPASLTPGLYSDTAIISLTF